MSERAGIEIDYCPDCRGVWLDRGELDKIIDRAAADAAPAPAPTPTPSRDDRRPSPDRQYGDGYGKPYRKKKKEHWLMEIFD